MKIILYVSLCVSALFVSVRLLLSDTETKTLKQAYGHEAVKALTLDAASTFPTVKGGIGDSRYWRPSETPCVFTTNVVQVQGNSRHVGWDDWPSNRVPGCKDFYAPKNGTYDPETTLPQQCLPAMTIQDVGGPELSFLAIVAAEAKVDALDMASLSQEKRNALAKLEKLPHYHYTSDFIRGGGLDGVSVNLIERQECDGFRIFRFQTEVAYPKSMRPSLEANGYTVSFK